MDEEFQTAVVHVVRFGKGERFAHEARKPLPQSVDPPLNVRRFALLLADGLVPLFGNRLSISLPQVTVAGRLFVTLGDGPPQPLAGRSATIALHKRHDLAGFSAYGQPNPHLLAFAVDERPQLVQFEYLLLLLARSCDCVGEDEGVFEVEVLYLFLSQLMTVVGETPKVRLSPRRLERSW